MTLPNSDTSDSLNERDAALRNNRQTVAAYESCALSYAKATKPALNPSNELLLRQFAETVGVGGRVLEIGSGPGWDADFLETLGVTVRRTDVTQAFIRFQTERGKTAELLDLTVADLGGPFDGVVALYVLQHIDRALIDDVLGKISNALRPGAALLVSLKEGQGDCREAGSGSTAYHVALWSQAEFQARLSSCALRPEHVVHSSDDDGDWFAVLARRSADQDLAEISR